MKSLLRRLLITSASIALYACGGGGGGSSAAPSSNTGGEVAYPLQAAFLSFLQSEKAVSFKVSGTCDGTATVMLKLDPEQTGTGILSPGYSDIGTETATYTNCTQDQLVANNMLVLDTEYLFVQGRVTSLPSSAKVGQTAQLSGQAIYADEAKTTFKGTLVFSYALEADTGNTAVLNVIAKRYNTANTVVLTKQSRFKVDATGNVTPVGIDMLSATTAHLVFTPN